MSPRSIWRVLILAVVLGTGSADKDEDMVSWKCGKTTPRTRTFKIADDGGLGNASAKRQFVVGYGDYGDASDWQNDHFVGLASGSGSGSVPNGTIPVNKCCSRGSYFDIETYNCVPAAEDGDRRPDFLRFAVGNASRYLVREKLPNCGNSTVLLVRLATDVQVDGAGVTVDGERHNDQTYCLDEGSANQTVVLTCHEPGSTCKGRRRCFRKCCPLGQSYGPSSRKCQKTNYPFRPDFVQLSSLEPDDSVRLSDFGLFLGDACGQQGKYLLERDEGELSYLDDTGTLYVPMYQKCYGKDEFCVEHVELGNYTGIGSFLCFSKGSSHFENSQLQYLLLSLGLILSCMFLMLTFLVYLFSPKSHTLYGKTIMCYIACLFTAYLCLAVVELKSTDLDKSLCTYMGYAILFSFLAAFFWLSVISFDVWKTFSIVRPGLDPCLGGHGCVRMDIGYLSCVVRSLERAKSDRSKNIRFLWYSLYAWSFPCIITGCCAVANQWPNFPVPSIKPDIGEENCWFSRHTKAIYVFFIAPISIIITCNVVFYIQTAWRIWKVKSDISKMGKQKRTKFTANKDQFLINGKLFVVMGITWSLEVISFFVPHPIWYITDTANALHGVFIFAVFVLKKKVFQHVSDRIRYPLKSMKQLSNSSGTTSSTVKNAKGSVAKDKTQTVVATSSGSDSNRY